MRKRGRPPSGIGPEAFRATVRFGDYSGITLNPDSKLGIWAATEYAKAGCLWGTELGSVTP